MKELSDLAEGLLIDILGGGAEKPSKVFGDVGLVFGNGLGWTSPYSCSGGCGGHLV